MAEVNEVDPATLRRVVALVDDGRATLIALESNGTIIRRKNDPETTTIRIAIAADPADWMGIICKTLTPQQAYEEAEREFTLAGERLEAIRLGRALSPYFVASTHEAPLCAHSFLQLELAIPVDSIVCQWCRKTWKREA